MLVLQTSAFTLGYGTSSRGGIRTPDVVINSHALLPAELPWNVDARFYRVSGKARSGHTAFSSEPTVRIELTIFRLQGGCSTTELHRHGLAGQL